MAIVPFKRFDLEKLFDDEWIKAIEHESMMLKTPKMDIYETDKEIVAEIELPGIDPKDINIEVGETSLKIETRKEIKKEEKNKGYFKKEIGAGYYRRIVSLPGTVKKEKASADYKNGILKIFMPKTQGKKEEKGVKIKIGSKK